MIAHSILLPKLSPKDQAALRELHTEYETRQATIASYGHDKFRDRKRQLEAKLATAPGSQLLSIGAELETLEKSYAQAQEGARSQLRTMGPRYGKFFTKLLNACDAHADELIDRATKEWRELFVSFGAEPSGVSPIVAHIQAWKRDLAEKRKRLEPVSTCQILPPPPTHVLPYSV